MKYKLVEGSTFVLAGVASYSSVSKKQQKSKQKQQVKFDFDFDFDFDKESFKNDMKDFKKDMQAFGKDMKNRYGKQNENGTPEPPGNWESNFDFANFGENLSKSIRSMTDSISKNIQANMNNLDENMENMAQNAEAFAEDIEYATEKHWQGNHNADDYDVWSLQALFKDIYENSPLLQEKDITPKKTYEVSAYELDSSMNDQLTFIGCKIEDADGLDYKTVTQQLTADSWLFIKLTKDEYNKDWLKKIEDLEAIEGYTIEPYFVVHHPKKDKKDEDTKIKISIPLKVK